MEGVHSSGRIYIGIYYLKILHYFFFSLAVFTLTAGIVFWESFTLESVSLFSLCSVYSFLSLYIAVALYKSYRKLATPLIVIRSYLLPYPLLGFWTFGLTLFLVYVFPYLSELVYAFLFVNYYIVFLLFVGILVGRFDVVKRLFEFYDYFNLRRAVNLAAKYSHVVDVTAYEIGSDLKVDDMLDDIWKNKDYPLSNVKELETRLCEIEIMKIDKSIRVLEKRKGRMAEEEKLLERLKVDKAEFMEKIQKIQQFAD